MPTYRDEAVVLRTQRLGEADRIVTLLGKERGKVRAVARGVRRTSSKFGARLEPFMVVDVQCYAGRNLDTVTQAVTLAAYGRDLVEDYSRYSAASVIVEAAERVAEAEPSPQQYTLVIGALRALTLGARASQDVLDSYLLRSLSLAGWAPALDDCARCGAPGPHERFSVQLGGVVCQRCTPAGIVRVDEATVQAVRALLSGDWAMLDGIEVSARARASGIVSAYSQHYLDKKLRSMQVLEHDRLLGRLEPATAVALSSAGGGAINADNDPGAEPGTEETA
ncbi:DNA repair protein RecO [Pseudoclavibacter sp. RFBJ3]|uniref:DNA repair protein RecO n=1 Tax=unclassified Pseudoclavibacter TaxID=2615177 RepID=UPI000CE8AADF|nr:MULTISPECIES: DNA repair protein RecO [unclassified Pseudoclavibacter]PPF84876.1 DNA repair protein RecO [Pseudoclavibacter sp. RFBJ5]PPF93880.1 DNA repair protein RecO [Pseudoclavibacter sp. RFBJ3]PPF98598.1 DNA repair protein RecO [Pseudoclavibacter sp. RFBH5]PPG24442.1 DNA repair protein RecO [Pseudoclavibacter sp. RFBI4]